VVVEAVVVVDDVVLAGVPVVVVAGNVVVVEGGTVVVETPVAVHADATMISSAGRIRFTAGEHTAAGICRDGSICVEQRRGLCADASAWHDANIHSEVQMAVRSTFPRGGYLVLGVLSLAAAVLFVVRAFVVEATTDRILSAALFGGMGVVWLVAYASSAGPSK
jgi:hypothetical protein